MTGEMLWLVIYFSLSSDPPFDRLRVRRQPVQKKTLILSLSKYEGFSD
jgi:hypothetical protein